MDHEMRPGGRRPWGGTPPRDGTGRRRVLRVMVATVLAVAPGAVLPAAATAASGRLSSGDFTGPAGTQHYELFVPSRHRARARAVVVALHGCTQNADTFRRLSRWDALAEAKRFIVVFPEQDPKDNYFKCWNFFLPAHMHRGSGEPARIAGLTRSVARKYRVDRRRVYAAGLSAGGAMASVMGATYPDLFAAIGIGSGCEYAATATCAGFKSADPVAAGRQAYAEMGSRARPMPFIAFQGDADTTVPPVNADQLVQQWLTTDDLADDGSLDRSVPPAPAKSAVGSSRGGRSYMVRTYLDKSRKKIAEYWLVHGMAHAWSGGNPAEPYSDASGPDETREMYAFFTSHRRS